MSHVRKHQQQQKLAGFPLMTTAEVCDCLSALGISATPEDLTKPTSASTQTIWQALIDSLMGVSIHLFEGPKQALLGMMPYKELYGDSLQFIMFFNHCHRLASLCGIDDFTTADLTRPEPGRLRSILSGVMNFAKFRDERVNYHLELSHKAHEQQERIHELTRKLDKVDASIQDIANKNASDRPLMEEKRKQSQAVRDELLELRSKQINLSGEVEDLKKARKELIEDANRLQKEFLDVQANTAAMRNRIVRSPERIKRQISEMSSQVAADRATHAQYMRKVSELSNRLSVIEGLEADLRRLVGLLRVIERHQEEVKKFSRTNSDLVDKLAKADIEGSGLEERRKLVTNQIENVEARGKKQKQLADEFQHKASIKVKDLMAQYEVHSKQRAVFEKDRDALLAQEKEIQAEMAAFVQQSEAEINDLLEEYWEMRKQAESYMNAMTDKLGLKLQPA